MQAARATAAVAEADSRQQKEDEQRAAAERAQKKQAKKARRRQAKAAGRSPLHVACCMLQSRSPRTKRSLTI